MSCANFERLIALDVAGDLSTRDAAEVRAHLDVCEACRTLAGDLSSDLLWLQSAHREPADRAALHRVRVQVMRRLESEQSRWNRPFGGLAVLGGRWRWVAVSAAAILLGGVLWWAWPSQRPEITLAADAPGDETRLPAANSVDDPARPSVPRAADSRFIAGSRKTSRPLAPPAADAAAPHARREEKPPGTDHSVDPGREVDRATALARAGRGAPSRTGAPSNGGQVDSERKIEVVTAVLPESRGASAETVMLKMPTSNPDVIIYWLMDDENQVVESNEGD